MATKVGYSRENIQFFAFDWNKKGMVAVDLKAGWLDYETDGAALSEHFN